MTILGVGIIDIMKLICSIAIVVVGKKLLVMGRPEES